MDFVIETIICFTGKRRIIFFINLINGFLNRFFIGERTVFDAS